MEKVEPDAPRAEIQTLRALAVLVVVVYHLWPAVLPGGFVGVDVFFAISGFLITGQLVREVERRGRISLPGFWARRARRLLPAALLTLLCCAVATIVLVPQLHWPQYLTEIGASTAYVQNWQLAGDAVDYLAAANEPSPVQHFWSLSAEEQFYLAWPLLIVLAIAIAGTRRAIAIVLGTATALSFGYSLLATSTDPAVAYFVTPARAWEFGAGGLLALLSSSAMRASAPTARVLSWAGLAAILCAALAYGDATPFPGWAALLPVLGALAVIRAGMPSGRASPAPVLSLRPLRFVGDISYAVYLWHWPLLIFAPFVVAGETVETRLGVLTLTILIAWLTTRLVEDPVRRSALLAARAPRLTFAGAAAATACVAAILVAASLHVDSQIVRAQQAAYALVASNPQCLGAASRDPDRPCDNPRLRHIVVPAPLAAGAEPNAPCTRMQREGPITVCEFGVRDRKAAANVALVGDSHAAHWRATIETVAADKRWRGVSITRTSCPFSSVRRALSRQLSRREAVRCAQWNDALPGWFARHPQIQTVIVVSNTGGSVDVPTGRSELEVKVDGFRRAWRALPRSVRQIIVIRDTPKARSSTLDCVYQAVSGGRRPGSACALPRSDSLEPDPAVLAARGLTSRRTRVVDLTKVFCDTRQCFPVIGGTLVYKDEHHLTSTFARTLAPLMERRVAQLKLTLN